MTHGIFQVLTLSATASLSVFELSSPGAHQQEPLSPILCLGVNPFPSRLFIERLSGEVSHAHSSKTRSKQSKIECIKAILKIQLLGKGLTHEISGDRVSC